MATMVSDTPTPQEMPTSANKVADGMNFILPAPEIKNEPPVEIIDTPNTRMSSDDSSDDRRSNDSPKIRLTPTAKLLAAKPIDPKRKFPCPYDNCNKSYGKSSHLRSHLTWHTGIKPFVCQEPNCGKGFTRSDELNRHIRTHTGEKPFECIQCTKKFSRSDHLTKHLATHVKQLKSKPVKPVLRLPQNEPQLHEEPEAKKTCTTMQVDTEFIDGKHFLTDLVEAVTAKQSNSNTEPENLTDEPTLKHQPIKIKLEKPEFSNQYQIVPNGETLAHNIKSQETSHGAASDSEDELPHQLITPDLTMVCPPSPDIKTEMNDDAIMPEANALILPMQNTSCGYRQIPEFCGFEFEDERPFGCKQCGKNFKRQDDLNRHTRTHTGEKPYACTHCEKRFVRSDHLKNHMKTHTRVR